MKISILTATYNREKLLPQLYQSLVRNSEDYSNFEWLIMDDGSTDHTEELITSWMKEGKINIQYYYQENAGKMAAINNLAKYVTGDIWIEMDSDDYFLDGVFKRIAKDYETLDPNAYGILYYKQLGNQEIKTDDQLQNKIIKLYDLHYQYGYSFDMAITFRTSFRGQFTYELEHNERFITEARMYYKMDQAYYGLLIKNDLIMHCEYQEDGYSKNILKIFKSYPYGYYEYFKELLNYPYKKIKKEKYRYMIKHYILFTVLTHRSYSFSVKQLKRTKDRFLFTLLYPFGKIKTKIGFKK